MKKIFVMGGGGFTRDQDLKFEKYLLSLCNKKNPKICFLPQASNESRDYIVKFYQSFLSLSAQPSWISLFGRVDSGWQDIILQQDIIYVGGGNTRSMLALWKEWGMDEILRKAYEQGIVLSGLSAGMICWFNQGITDSVWPLGIVKGLGFLSGSACPHFDTEIERQDFYIQSVANKTVESGYALYDDTGALFVDGQFAEAIKTKTGKKVKFVADNEIKIIESKLI